METLGSGLTGIPGRARESAPVKATLALFLACAALLSNPTSAVTVVTYGYDDLDRLRAVRRDDGPRIDIKYDEVGNIESRDVSNSPDTDQDLLADFVDTDDDNDLMPDTWEVRFSLDPLDPTDALNDLDGDGLSNLAEFQGGTDPTVNPRSAAAIFSIIEMILED